MWEAVEEGRPNHAAWRACDEFAPGKSLHREFPIEISNSDLRQAALVQIALSGRLPDFVDRG